MNKQAPKTAAEISARRTEIGALFRAWHPGNPPNYRELAAEDEQLVVEYREAETRESIQPSAEHLAKVREAEQREARVARALLEAMQ